MGKTILISSHILTELSDFCNTIGIVERGKLLVAGAVDDITRNLQGTREIEIKIKGDTARAVDILQRQEGVRSVETDNDALCVNIAFEMEDPSVLMEALMAGGVKVTGFSEKEVNLEDIFMRITKGAVQ